MTDLNDINDINDVSNVSDEDVDLTYEDNVDKIETKKYGVQTGGYILDTERYKTLNDSKFSDVTDNDLINLLMYRGLSNNNPVIFAGMKSIYEKLNSITSEINPGEKFEKNDNFRGRGNGNYRGNNRGNYRGNYTGNNRGNYMGNNRGNYMGNNRGNYRGRNLNYNVNNSDSTTETSPKVYRKYDDDTVSSQNHGNTQEFQNHYKNKYDNHENRDGKTVDNNGHHDYFREHRRNRNF